MKTLFDTPTQTVERPAPIPSLPDDADFIPPEVVVQEATALAPAAPAGGGSLSVFDLAHQEDGVAILERAVAVRNRMRIAAIALTSERDWLLTKADAGPDGETNITAMLCGPGYTAIADVFGIQARFSPRDAAGNWSPEKVYRDGSPPDVYGYRGVAHGYCAATKRFDEVEATRWNDEDFGGRQVDEAGSIVKRGRAAGGKNLDSDMRSALKTLLSVKIVAALTGIRTIGVDDLKRAGKDPGKCRLGNGFGSAAERGSRGAGTDDSIDVALERKLLREELLSLVGGDTGEARGLLKKLTAWETKDGRSGAFDSVDRMSKAFQFKQAWERLRSSHSNASSEADIAAKRKAAKGGGE